MTRKSNVYPLLAVQVALLLLMAPPLLAQALDAVLLAPDLWKLDQTAFESRAAALGFRWVSAARDSSRAASQDLTFGSERVVEVVVRFDSNLLSGATLSFYNRGDLGDISNDRFEEQVLRVCEKMDTLLKGKSREINSRQAVRADRKVKRLRWTHSPSAYTLECAYSRPRGANVIQPEFINLSVSPQEARSSQLADENLKVTVGASDLKKRIKKTDNGDVYLENVPMVDQGQKGYCAVAATERVMRYYGVEVNQHELAQKASTASGGGTDPASLIKALKTMTNVLGVRVKTMKDFDIKELMSTVRSYNREARKAKENEIVLPQSGVINIGDIFDEMDKTIYLAMRTKSVSEVDHFVKIVSEKINAGYPVLWGVMIGIVEETPAIPQLNGGHLRLIIGYNTKTSEILYSDTWGPGHELKRMKKADANAITMTLSTIEPR